VLGGAKGGSIDFGGRASWKTNYITKTPFSREYIMTIFHSIEVGRKTERISFEIENYALKWFKMLDWTV
jgi:hypothetical protein